jgi:MFS family permease
MCAGVQMSITSLAMRDATKDLLQIDNEVVLAQWFAWHISALLLGAAAGGLIFGRIGDHWGRTRALALSILWFSVLSGVSYFAQTANQLILLRFLTCLGIGGVWPNGVSLVAEAMPQLARPLAAGAIGSSSTIGITMMAAIAMVFEIRPDHWRWVMLLGSLPAALGLVVWRYVPESPQWLGQGYAQSVVGSKTTLQNVFRPPIMKFTLLGIAVGTIPLFGGWGSSHWLVPWAGSEGVATSGVVDHTLKAATHFTRSLAGVFGCFAGSWITHRLGWRKTYFLISLASLLIAQYIFRFLHPFDRFFLPWVALLGFISNMYFGWLPLFLPELFPTRVRATGSGVSFHFGRIVCALALIGTGAIINHYGSNYAEIGQTTSLIFGVGMVIAFLVPITSPDHES